MIFERFAASKAHRFVCVDEYSHCVGIVSLSDLFNYFIQ
jgi:5'-AMP-activated protein kinase regulatory gamma subunit